MLFDQIYSISAQIGSLALRIEELTAPIPPFRASMPMAARRRCGCGAGAAVFAAIPGYPQVTSA